MSEFYSDSSMMIKNKSSMCKLSIITFLWIFGSQVYLEEVYYMQGTGALG